MKCASTVKYMKMEKRLSPYCYQGGSAESLQTKGTQYGTVPYGTVWYGKVIFVHCTDRTICTVYAVCIVCALCTVQYVMTLSNVQNVLYSMLLY